MFFLSDSITCAYESNFHFRICGAYVQKFHILVGKSFRGDKNIIHADVVSKNTPFCDSIIDAEYVIHIKRSKLAHL